MNSAPIVHSRPWIVHEDRAAVLRTLEKGLIASGRQVKEFEAAVSRRVNVGRAVACSSGTAAMSLALRALDIGPGDEVILPTYVCWNVLAAVTSMGAVPRLCDVNEAGVLSPETVATATTAASKAIIAVHIFGHPCDVAALLSFGVPVVEDACQAFGLTVAGQPAGSLGTLGCFSFNATKCLSSGEGGMVVSNDSVLMGRLNDLARREVRHNNVGASALSDMQAALALSQLSRYDEFLSRRREIFECYGRVLEEIVVAPGYPDRPDFLFRFTLRPQKPFALLQRAFLKHGIHVRRGVDELLHRRLGLPDTAFPVAVRIFEQTLSIPFYPALDDVDVAKVTQSLKDVLRVD